MQIGKELELKIEVNEENQAVMTFTHVGSVGFATFIAGLDAVKLIDKITDAIPGHWDDDIFDSLAVKLLSKKTGAQ